MPNRVEFSSSLSYIRHHNDDDGLINRIGQICTVLQNISLNNSACSNSITAKNDLQRWSQVPPTTASSSSSSTSTTTTTPLSKRKNMSMSPVYTIDVDEGQTMHQLKVSAVPLVSLNSAAGRIRSDKKGCDDVQGFDKHDSEDGSTLADFLNLLSPDPGFESACGGDCSPPPVDLSALDGLALDFPLNGCCNGDTGYGSSSSLGGGSPPSSGSSSSVLHAGVESDSNQFRDEYNRTYFVLTLGHWQCRQCDQMLQIKEAQIIPKYIKVALVVFT